MKGESDDKKLCWSDTERLAVSKGASPHEVVYLNPDDPITDPANTLGQFGRDMYQVMVATAIIVDARERRGLGIGVEMAAAATFGTPIIVVAPRNSKYRSDKLEYRGTTVSNYVHPHVGALAADVVDDFVAAGEAILRFAHDERSTVRDDRPTWINQAIDEYVSNVLPRDTPMVKVLQLVGQIGDWASA
jgi:hypothetical protein